LRRTLPADYRSDGGVVNDPDTAALSAIEVYASSPNAVC
jgi:hypothetical protein